MLVECCYRFAPLGQIYTGLFDTEIQRVSSIEVFNKIDVTGLVNLKFSKDNYDGSASYNDIVSKFMFRNFGLVAINFNEHMIVEVDNGCYAVDSFVSGKYERYVANVTVLNYDTVYFGVAKTKLLTCKRAQPIALLTALKDGDEFFYYYNGKKYTLMFEPDRISSMSDANLSKYMEMFSRDDAVGICKSGNLVVRDDENYILRLE